VIATYGVSERLACRVLGQHRSPQRKIRKEPEDEAALTAGITALATQSSTATMTTGAPPPC